MDGDEGDPAGLDALVEATNGFAFDLYEALLGADIEGNVALSPISISAALSMAYAGARGDTRDQMREVLGYALADSDVHDAFGALLQELHGRGSPRDRSSTTPREDQPEPFRLTLTNAVWGQRGYPFRDEYRAELADRYGSGLREVEFVDEPAAARDRINDWVADRTEDRISDLVPEGAISDLTRLVLANAVYFRGNWLHPFDETMTEARPFTALDSSSTAVPVMERTETYPYAEVGGTQAVDLPYYGESVSMLVVLPPAGAFEAYETDLDSATLTRLVDDLEEQTGTVALPRFEVSAGFGLGPVLAAMGLSDAFDASAADFSGMVDPSGLDRPLAIDEVYHDTHVSVDEQGTEAAAASGLLMAELAIVEPFEFVVDRPFLFVIRDRPTGAVLFVGRVVDPGETE